MPPSLAIDAGNYTLLSGAAGVGLSTAQDLDGETRVVDDLDTDDTGTGPPAVLDMGCCEQQPP